MNIALADYNEKARKDREKSAAKPFVGGGDMGGGTLAAKVAGQIEANRVASELGEREEAVAPDGTETAGQTGVAGADVTARDAGVFDSDDGPSWPDVSAESAFLADEKRSSSGAVASRAAKRPEAADEDDDDEASGADKTAAKVELPALDSLVSRLSVEVRELLEDKFRAQFVKVRKYPRRLVE